MKSTTLRFSIFAAVLLSTSAYAVQQVHSSPVTIYSTAKDEVPLVKSYARDSTRYSTDRKVVTLYGDAKVETKDVSVVADEIIYDATSQTLKVKHLQSLRFRNKEEKGQLDRSSLTLKLVDKGYEVVK